MASSALAREDWLRNPLTDEQRELLQDRAEAGDLLSRGVLVEIDRLRMEICDWSSTAEKERLADLGEWGYYGPANAADERGWGYLYPAD